MIPAILAVHLTDLALTLVIVGTYGTAAEANGFMRAVLEHGPLAALAAKAALLSLICAAAALGPRYRRLLLGGALVGGLLGAASGIVGLAA